MHDGGTRVSDYTQHGMLPSYYSIDLIAAKEEDETTTSRTRYPRQVRRGKRGMSTRNGGRNTNRRGRTKQKNIINREGIDE